MNADLRSRLASIEDLDRKGRFLPASVAAIEVREAKSGPGTIAGLAAVFYDPGDPGTAYRLWDDFEERIMPGAFDRAVAEGDDVRCLLNHDVNQLLGRTKSGTLRLSITKRGLAYEADTPDTQPGRDAVTTIRRGDIDGSSFGFRCTDSDLRIEPRDGKELWIREVRGVILYDASPVTYPAYEATTAEARGALRTQLDGHAKSERDRVAGELADDAQRGVRLALAERA